MIRCLPRGICSWDYILQFEGWESDAELKYKWASEIGEIRLGDEIFPIVKHGWMSGHWDLADAAGEVLASGIKPTALIRSFDLSVGGETYLLQARSSLGRTFELLDRDQVLVEMVPDHAFTRRATMQSIEGDLPPIILAFSFWLVGLMWKRQQQRSNSG